MENVVRGKLKLKSGSKLKVDGARKSKKAKSKKSKKEKRHRDDHGDGHGDEDEREEDEKKERVVLVTTEMTPAQRRYDELRKKREQEEIEKVASKTYRERVEELNQYLGRLTEHHDIPRVSAAGNG